MRMATHRAALRIALNVGLDSALAAAAVPLSRWLMNPDGDPLHPAWPIAWAVVAMLIGGLPFRLSTQYWRFATISDLVGVAAASVAATALFVIGMVAGFGMAPPSPAYPALHLMSLALLLTLPRVAYRMMQGEQADDTSAQPVLLVGAGEGADLFLTALAAERSPPFHVVGLLSLGQAQTGRRIHGMPILGAVNEAAKILAGLRAEDRLPASLVLTEADIPGPVLAGLMQAADAEGLRVARAPRPTALDTEDGGSHLDLRPVAIEDLLNRAQWKLDREGMARLIAGQCVLITGAGGTIGSELVRQVAALAPRLLVLLDNGEYALWQIEQELASAAGDRRVVIADIRDAARIQAIMDEYRPDLVFHAAALKHVPMVEGNPTEGLLTNAYGTRNVADAARASGAQAMVLISTDKAVNPTSVMGAAKRLAEMYCQSLDIEARANLNQPNLNQQRSGMRCITVRFGNVLGSTGSVVPLFQRQLARGGPLTVTHPDMERYFMTVREAVGLVLQASVVGCDRDIGDGGIFVLDMGEPVKIVDLAYQMIRLAGLRPDVDIKVVFTGLRPGEKLFEEMFHGREPPRPTDFPGLLMATPRTADPAIVGRAIDEIAAACRAGQEGAALAMLGRMVPEFDHNADGSAGLARG